MTGSGFWDAFWTGFQMPFKANGDFVDKTLGVIPRGVLAGNLGKILEKVALNTIGDIAKIFIKGSKGISYIYIYIYIYIYLYIDTKF